MGYLIVFFGAGIGGAARHGVNLLAARWLGGSFPWGTLFVNMAGGMAMGLIAEYFALKSGLPQEARLFLTTGILGGFTTFSAFSLEVALMIERGEMVLAGGYVLASAVLSIGALFLGLTLTRSLLA